MPRRRAALAAVVLALSAGAGAPARAADPVRIFPLGTDVTAGSCITSYLGALGRGLDQDGVAHEFVGTQGSGTSRHEGHAGYYVDELDGGLDGTGRWTAEGPHWGSWLTGAIGYHEPIYPDVTVLYAGETDIEAKRDPASAPWPMDVDYVDPTGRATYVDMLTARLKHLVDKVFRLRPGSRLVLSNLVREQESPANLVSGEYSAAIAGLVADEAAAGRRIVLADARSALAGPAMVGPRLVTPVRYQPGYCPTPLGNDVLGSVLRDGVEAALALP